MNTPVSFELAKLLKEKGVIKNTKAKMKVLVTAKEYPQFYNKELFVLWVTETDKGKFYHCSDKPGDSFCKVYLGENQIKLNY